MKPIMYRMASRFAYWRGKKLLETAESLSKVVHGFQMANDYERASWWYERAIKLHRSGADWIRLGLRWKLRGRA